MKEAEQKLQKSWLESHFVPLNTCIPMFEVKRIRAVARTEQMIGVVVREPGRASRSSPILDQVGYEIPLSTPDGAVRGVADAVVLEDGGITIRDYKSGQIFEGSAGTRTLDRAYVDQISMYAAIYAEQNGVWPLRLEIVPMAGPAAMVPVDRDSCRALLEDARKLLDWINQCIDSANSSADLEELLARPAPNTCNRCQFRPGCEPYRGAREVADRDEAGWPNDIAGTFISSSPLRNLTLGLEVSTRWGIARLRGFSEDPMRHPALADISPGSPIEVYGLGATADKLSWAELTRTTIYAR